MIAISFKKRRVIKIKSAPMIMRSVSGVMLILVTGRERRRKRSRYSANHSIRGNTLSLYGEIQNHSIYGEIHYPSLSLSH